MQLDLGFDDIVFPKPKKIEFPTILNLPKPRLLGYSKESAIAEKFEAMVKRGTLNSRMKDFYDIWLLINQFDFSKNKLHKAITLTFHKRGTPLTGNIVALTKNFATEKQVQWEAFSKKIDQNDIPQYFYEIISAINGFISPVISVEVSPNSTKYYWKAPGPWMLNK